MARWRQLAELGLLLALLAACQAKDSGWIRGARSASGVNVQLMAAAGPPLPPITQSGLGLGRANAVAVQADGGQGDGQGDEAESANEDEEQPQRGGAMWGLARFLLLSFLAALSAGLCICFATQIASVYRALRALCCLCIKGEAGDAGHELGRPHRTATLVATPKGRDKAAAEEQVIEDAHAKRPRPRDLRGRGGDTVPVEDADGRAAPGFGGHGLGTLAGRHFRGPRAPRPRTYWSMASIGPTPTSPAAGLARSLRPRPLDDVVGLLCVSESASSASSGSSHETLFDARQGRRGSGPSRLRQSN